MKSVILCVDDERIVLKSLRDQITRNFGQDYTCELAESPEEALEVIEELEGDGEMTILIIVSDWLMPNMKGDEFLIKVHQKYPKIVKVMLTGQADEKAIKKARDEADLYSYIPKPWDERNLVDVIRAGLNKNNE